MAAALVTVAAAARCGDLVVDGAQAHIGKPLSADESASAPPAERQTSAVLAASVAARRAAPLKLDQVACQDVAKTACAESAATDSEAAFVTPRSSSMGEPDSEPEALPSPSGVAPLGRAAAAPLQAPPMSWAAQRRLLRAGGGCEVSREIRSILNKLTVEKFQQLSQKLTQCGIATKDHLVLLITEILEKAANQHHFMDMYADVCVFLNGFFSEHPVVGGPGGFRSVLRAECRGAFERLLAAPEGLGELDEEERQRREAQYKQRMVGNIRFVGALLTRGLLPNKLLPALLELLFQDPTPEAIEAATALLTVAGPAFDKPGTDSYDALESAFASARKLARGGRCGMRASCLLRDLLELRARGWRARAAGLKEAPAELRAVAERAAKEAPPSAQAPGHMGSRARRSSRPRAGPADARAPAPWRWCARQLPAYANVPAAGHTAAQKAAAIAPMQAPALTTFQ